MIKLACIAGAGEILPHELIIPDGAMVIAADGGLDALENAGVSADLVVGDFDSLGRVPEGANVIKTPAEKDDTDTMLAVKIALEQGCEKILIYGGMGGRFAHSIANLQTLQYIANRGARGFLIGDSVCTVIKDDCIAFDQSFRGYISVFAVGGMAEGVDLKGLKYPLENHTLTTDFPLGVSNEFTGGKASVSVGSGSLLVIWRRHENGLLPI